MVGIDRTKASLVDLSQLICDGLTFAKDGISILNFHKIFGILSDIRSLASSAKPVFEEMKDLDAQEFEELSRLCVDLVMKMVGELAE